MTSCIRSLPVRSESAPGDGVRDEPGRDDRTGRARRRRVLIATGLLAMGSRSCLAVKARPQALAATCPIASLTAMYGPQSQYAFLTMMGL